jgi:hypothetical protein
MTTTRTTLIWTGGEGRGRGSEKDNETTTVVCNMGNICAYLPAMMTGCTMTYGRYGPAELDLYVGILVIPAELVLYVGM